MRLLVSLLVWLLRATLVTRGSLALENLALRQQLATCARLQKQPRLKPEERTFWYVEFHNRARPSQALHAIPDPYPALRAPPPTNGKLSALPMLGGVQHDYRFAA